MATKRQKAFTPAAEFRITRLDTVRVLADPLRLRLLESMASRLDDAWTVKQLAKALGEPPTKLYYHVNLLEEHGLLIVTGSRLVSGIVEKSYQLVAGNVSVDRGLLSTGDHGVGEALHSVLTTILGGAADDIQRAIDSGVATMDREPEAGREPVLLAKGLDRLPPERATEFRDRLRALMTEFGEEPDADPEAKRDQRVYGLVIAFYPMADVMAPTERPQSPRAPREPRKPRPPKEDPR